MQISATRHSSLISMVVTAGAGSAMDASGGNTCEESVSEATTKDFSSTLAVASATFSGAASGVLAVALLADGASSGSVCDESGSEATTKDFCSSRFAALSVAFSGADWVAFASSRLSTAALATTIARGVLVGAVLAMRDGSRRSWIETARAFSTEALTFPTEAEPKPASQAKTQLARAVPARRLIRRCAFVANRHGSMIRPPKARMSLIT
jgi:hypothetical protein